MKFAFSNVLCPQSDMTTLIGLAKEHGYDGVELLVSTEQAMSGQIKLLGADPAAVKGAFVAAGVQVAALASPISYIGSRAEDERSAQAIGKLVEAASSAGAGLVKIRDSQLPRRQTRTTLAASIAGWLTPVAQRADERGVGIALENLLAFRTGQEMWALLEAIGQPSVGCCWDVLNAAAVGESPVISVPVLNAHIFCAQIRDAKLVDGSPQYSQFGQGDVQIYKFLSRLQGIGYNGWVTLAMDKSLLGADAKIGEVLADVRQKLRQWTEPKPSAPSPAAKKPVKPPETVTTTK